MTSYIASAEPVGSRTLSKLISNKWSSATIRNVMVDLEEQGFLYKPHVVAGRVPTGKAFRYYVNSLLVPRPRKTGSPCSGDPCEPPVFPGRGDYGRRVAGARQPLQLHGHRGRAQSGFHALQGSRIRQAVQDDHSRRFRDFLRHGPHQARDYGGKAFLGAFAGHERLHEREVRGPAFLFAEEEAYSRTWPETGRSFIP